MGRAALSASRCLDVLDLLAAFPDRDFTLAEIGRAIGISPASCHAVVGIMESRGYVTRNPARKTYGLGPVPIAVGSVAMKRQPLVARARQVVEHLQQELGLTVLLNTISGNEGVAILSCKDARGGAPGMAVGERMPFIPPIGAPFFAWRSDEIVDRWLAQIEAPKDAAIVAEWRRALRITRERGYQIILRVMNGGDFAQLMEQMAAGRASGAGRAKLTDILATLDRQLAQPETIEDDALYDVGGIAAPIFDANGRAVFCMAIGGIGAAIPGRTLRHYADRLVAACLEVMRANREHG